MKRQAIAQKKILANYDSGKQFASKTHKDSSKLNSKKGKKKKEPPN